MIYIWVFLSSVFFAYLAERSKDKGVIVLCSVISILIPSILAGLRTVDVGIDVNVYALPHYLTALEYNNFFDFLARDRYKEAGYYFLVYHIAHLTHHVNWCLFAYSLITVTCTYIGAYKHRDKIKPSLTMLMFFLFWYNYTFNVMRQFMAASVMFMGLDTLEHGKYSKFMFYVIFASLFHISALLLLPPLMILRVIISSPTFQKRAYVKFAFMIAIAYMLFRARSLIISIIGVLPNLPKLNTYANYIITGSFDSTQYTRVFILMGELVMFALYSFGANKVFISNKIGKDFYQFIVLLCMMYRIILGMYPRMVLYYDYANLLVLAAIPSFVRSKHLKAIIGFTVIIVMLYHWHKMYIVAGWGRTWPYKSIL